MRKQQKVYMASFGAITHTKISGDTSLKNAVCGLACVIHIQKQVVPTPLKKRCLRTNLVQSCIEKYMVT